MTTENDAEEAGEDDSTNGASHEGSLGKETDIEAVEFAPAPSGLLPERARLALCELLSRGTLWRRTHASEYEAYLVYRDQIGVQLANMNLAALHDSRSSIVVLFQRLNRDDDAPALVRKRTLTLYDTFVVLILRKAYRDREIAGESAIFIDEDQIADQLVALLPLTKSSSRDRKKLSGSLEWLKQHRLLIPVRGEDGRYEISPAIQAVVSTAQLTSLLRRYQELAAGLPGATAGTDEGAGDD